MAKELKILAKDNAAKIIIDGNEIHDVISYKLTEDEKGAQLELVIAINEVEVEKPYMRSTVQVPQKSLICAAQHIKSMREQHLRGRKSDFSAPCAKCQLNNQCSFNWLETLTPIFRESNVKISVVHQAN